MENKIDKNLTSVSIYDWTYNSVPLSELKEWVDSQISAGKTHVRLDLEWGYYDDIESLYIIAE